VLPFEKILSLALPKKWLPAFQSAIAAPQQSAVPTPATDLGITFLNVARESGLNAKTIFGGEHKNKYLLETTGCGVAFYDFDNDGWLDIFLVNGWRLEGFPGGQEPAAHLVEWWIHVTQPGHEDRIGYLFLIPFIQWLVYAGVIYAVLRYWEHHV